MSEDLPSYIKGARFIQEGVEFDDWMWPRDPERYTPSRKTMRRFRDLGGIITSDDIEGAIRYGEMYPAARGCIAFVNNLGGVALYVIVTADLKDGTDLEARPSEDKFPDLDTDDFSYSIVTIWPYVYNRDAAWGTGRWSSPELDEIDNVEAEDGSWNHND